MRVACASTPAPRRAVERVVLDGAVSDLEVLRFAAHRCATDLGEQLRSRGLVAVAVAVVLELEEAAGVRVDTPRRPCPPATPPSCGRPCSRCSASCARRPR